jgi:hypothetical protein
VGENEEKTERSPEKKEIKREEKKSMAPPRGLERPTTIFIYTISLPVEDRAHHYFLRGSMSALSFPTKLPGDVKD